MTGFCVTSVQTALLDFIFNGGTFTPDTTLYMGLCTSVTQADGTITGEPTISTNGYARVELTVASNFGSASSGVITNNAQIDYPESTGAWSSGATLSYWFLSTASTGGTAKYFGLIDNGVAADGVAVTATGQQPSFKTSQISLNWSGI